MSFKNFVIIALAAIAAFSVRPASADRLVLMPTGNVLTTGDVRAEISLGASDERKIYWLNVGLARLELNAMRLDQGSHIVGEKTADVLGAEFSVLPETTLTPGIGIGVWDLTGQTEDGEGYYLALSKRVPSARPLPLPLTDIRLHVGFGVGGINGPFAGVEASLPYNLKLYAEQFQENSNVGVGWKLIRGVEARAYLIDGRRYYGLQITSVANE